MKREHSCFAVVLWAGLAACAPPPDFTASPPSSVTEPVQELTKNRLLNATYVLPDGREVTVAGGSYQEQPAAGAAMFVINITVAEDLIAYGDLDGDGVADASVIVFDSPGGSGVFGYVAAVLNADGRPVNADTADLGDRTEIRSNTVADGVILLDVTAHTPDDPLCCPSQEARWEFALIGGELSRTDLATPR